MDLSTRRRNRSDANRASARHRTAASWMTRIASLGEFAAPLLVALLSVTALTAPRGVHAALPDIVDCDGRNDSNIETGFDAGSQCLIRLTETIEFAVAADSIVENPSSGGFSASGDMAILTPDNEIPLSAASLSFEPSESTEFPFEILGTADLYPEVPLFEDATAGYEATAHLGIVSRATLEALHNTEEYQLPLAENIVVDENGEYVTDENGDFVIEEHAYLYFHFASGFKAELPIGKTLGLNEDAEDPFSVKLPEKAMTFILDPAEPYFFIAPDGEEAQGEGVDADLLALQEKTEQSLEDLLANDQLADREKYEAVRENIYRLDAGQLHGLNNDMLADFQGDPNPETVDRMLEVSETSRKLDRTRKGKDDNETVLADNEKDYTTPNLSSENRKPSDKQKDPMEGSSEFPEIEELAYSWLGGIPFAPKTTWGLPSDVGAFYGNIHLKTTVPLSKGIELEGTVVSYVGRHGTEIGGNGDVKVALSFPPKSPVGIAFEFDLGQASAGLRALDTEAATYFSGIAKPDLSWLPKEVPFVPANTTKVAGYISSDRPEDSVLHGYGQFGFDTSGFADVTGVPLNYLLLSEVEMKIDSEGVWARGRSGNSLHTSLQTGVLMEVEALIGLEDPSRSYIRMTGDVQVAGVGLAPAVVEAGGRGLFVGGAFVTPFTTVQIEGNITNRGPALAGSTEIVFPLGEITKAADAAHAEVVKAQQELDKINDAIAWQRGIVQAERDRDAARIRDAAAVVASARAKVSSIQRSIDREYGKISGYRKAISSKYKWYKRQAWYKKTWAYGVYSAYKVSKNAQIAAAYVRIGGLKAAKGVANTAVTVAVGVLNGLEWAATTIPIDADPRVAGLFAGRDIAMLAVSQAEKALGAIPVVDADVAGSIDLAIDASGISGTVSATFNGTNISEGRVVLGAKPQACINLPGGIGEVCAPF